MEDNQNIKTDKKNLKDLHNSLNEKEEAQSNNFLSKGERINESLWNNPLKEIDITLYAVIKSVCKIISNKNVGTGFLIKLYKNNEEFFCLMTN